MLACDVQWRLQDFDLEVDAALALDESPEKLMKYMQTNREILSDCSRAIQYKPITSQVYHDGFHAVESHFHS